MKKLKLVLIALLPAILFCIMLPAQKKADFKGVALFSDTVKIKSATTNAMRNYINYVNNYIWQQNLPHQDVLVIVSAGNTIDSLIKADLSFLNNATDTVGVGTKSVIPLKDSANKKPGGTKPKK